MFISVLYWLLLIAAPLLFVYAYPRFLFPTTVIPVNRVRYAATLHGLGVAIAIVLFIVLGSAFWRNPLRDGNSILLLGVPLVAVPVFLVAACSLLLRNTSTLTIFASFLFWPYWLLLALAFLGRFFAAPMLPDAFCCFLCFLVPILFAFAAGGISYRPALAHASAFAGSVAMPWIYWTDLRDTALGNTWTLFNVPDWDLGMYNGLHFPELTIVCIGLIVLAIATAALRLLPARWRLRGLPFRDRSWPAFLAMFVFLAIWFSESVMPYRISGAVDYVSWPSFQILHVEKRGFQFHETCIDIRGGYRGLSQSVSFSWNDRRLFHYRFEQNHASGELTQPLLVRTQDVIRSLQGQRGQSDPVKPLRAWNVDGWFVMGEGITLKSYIGDKGATPPPEIVELFNELAKIPRVGEHHSEMNDVCFGFCYDPLSALGLLFANHRCLYDRTRKDYVCR